MIPIGEVSHALTNRMRIRVRGMRGDDDWFAAVREDLKALPGVDAVQTNPRTASILVTGRSLSLRQVSGRAREHGLFELVEPDERQASSPGTLNAARAASLVLVGMAAAQAARGNIMVPAFTLLWSAFDLARWASEDKR